MISRKIFAVALISALAATSSFAASKKGSSSADPMPSPRHSGGSVPYGTAGCGLGSLAFKDKSSKVQQILAATTNGTSGNQTFAISTGTLNCEMPDGSTAQYTQEDVFVAANLDRLSRDAAAGHGETLTALGSLMGCQAGSGELLGRVAKANYDAIFRDASAQEPKAVVHGLKAALAHDSAAATACGLATL